jgi:predicted N-formylglutamate amidohydrolase
MPVTEVLGDPGSDSSLVLTCEHAGNEIPDDLDLALTAREHTWLEEHWGWDPGAADVVRTLVDIEDATAVLNRCTRLLCDVNRALHEDDLVRTHIEGEPVSFNRGLTHADVRRRIERFHVPYHDDVDRHLESRTEQNPDLVLISVHTFTPVLHGEMRGMELGVLFDRAQPYAPEVAPYFRESDLEVALNEPYSGIDGLIYSVKRHGVEHDVRHFEIEVRNDLVDTPEKARGVGRRIAEALRRIPWYGDS